MIYPVPFRWSNTVDDHPRQCEINSVGVLIPGEKPEVIEKPNLCYPTTKKGILQKRLSKLSVGQALGFEET